MSAAPAAVRFEEVHRALALFAEALDGRPHAVQSVDDPVADEAVIRLPAVMADFATRPDNRGALRLAVLRQVARAPGLAQAFDGWPRRRLLRHVFALLERLRIDSAIAQRYPGAHADLQRSRARALAARGPVRPAAARPMHARIEGLRRFTLGQRIDGDAVLHDILAIAFTVEAPAADAAHSVRAAHAICARLESPSARIDGATGTMQVPPSDAADEHDVGGTRPGSDAAGDAKASRSAAEGAWSTALAFTAERAQDGARTGTRPMAPRVRPPVPTTVRSYFYDEWDGPHQRYLPDWCRVQERRLRGDDLHFLHALRQRHAALASRVRHSFAAIRPESRQRLHGAFDGEEVDIDRVIEEAVARRAGQAADGRVFTTQQRARRDVCAAFLVDMSGSTGFVLPPPAGAAPPSMPDDEEDVYLYAARPAAPLHTQAPRRRVIDVAKDALGLMGDALHRLGDRHAVFGFSGDGRHQVDFLVAKAFDDAWSARTAAALASMQPMNATRTGAAVRHAVTRLAREPARTRVLIVVSDGYPQDSDYGPDARDAAYGIQDTARALREAEEAGIATFCIAIDPAGHDYLRTMCREDRYLVIDDVEALPEQLGKVYRALTTR